MSWSFLHQSSVGFPRLPTFNPPILQPSSSCGHFAFLSPSTVIQKKKGQTTGKPVKRVHNNCLVSTKSTGDSVRGTISSQCGPQDCHRRLVAWPCKPLQARGQIGHDRRLQHHVKIHLTNQTSALYQPGCSESTSQTPPFPQSPTPTVQINPSSLGLSTQSPLLIARSLGEALGTG